MKELGVYYPKAVSKDWLIEVGVEKDSLKKVTDLFVNDEVELNEKNLIELQQKAINVRLISNNLFAPLHRVSINQETRTAWSDFLKGNGASFEKFFHHPNVDEERNSYNRKQKIDWKAFVESDYQDWNGYQEKLGNNIKRFDNRTFYQQKEWKDQVGTLRHNYRVTVAKSMTEVLDGRAPITSIENLENFGFKTVERDYAWAFLGKEFACSTFNIKKVMNEGLSLKRFVYSDTLKPTESTKFLRDVNFGEEADLTHRTGLHLNYDEQVRYMKDIFVSTATPDKDLL